MRPTKFRRLVNEALQHRIETGESSLFTAPLLRSMEREAVKMAKAQDDHRTGEETYGYASKKQIEGNLVYISDRWRCAFRLRWLVDGLKKGAI